MKSRTKRQQKKIDYFIREKQSRREKQEIIHNEQLPKFIEKQLPVVRRLCRNLDQILIISSFVSPPLKTGLIDRLLVLAEVESVTPLICLNKCDLVEDESDINEVVSVYKNIGYPVFVTSAVSGYGILKIGKIIRNKRTALAGHSGVGKSSLLNRIQPDFNITTGDVSEWSNKGVHTTTQVTTYKLDESTEVIDLPGLKKLDFVDIHKDEARHYFREFAQYAEGCKFTNCLHLSEQNCAVKEAVENNHIEAQRYKSYCNFVQSL
jgi:ribosome biogenesis GTPase